MPQLDSGTYPSLLFWLCMSFGLLYFMLARFILPRAAQVFAGREAYLNQLTQQTYDLERQALVLEREITLKIEAAQQEASARLQAVETRLASDLEQQAQAWRHSADKKIKALTAELTEQQSALQKNVHDLLPTLIPPIMAVIMKHPPILSSAPTDKGDF